MSDAAWKGLPREAVEAWIAEAIGGDEFDAAMVVDSLGLRCVGWHHYTADTATSVPLFVLDRFPQREAEGSA